MDIEKLKSKRQLNVQEQSAIKKDGILREATYWRERGIPKGLSDVLKSKGVDVEKCVLIDYEQDFPGCNTDEGTVVTKDGCFYEFEMDLDKHREKLVELYVWNEITADIEINGRKPGTGATQGYLVLEVLEELNGSNK